MVSNLVRASQRPLRRELLRASLSAPVLESSSSLVTASAGNLVVSVPSGVEEGDLLVVQMQSRNCVLPEWGPAGSVGWGWRTLFIEDLLTDDYVAAYVKEAEASEPSDYTFVMSHSGTSSVAAVMHRISGACPEMIDVSLNSTLSADEVWGHSKGLLLGHFGSQSQSDGGKVFTAVPSGMTQVALDNAIVNDMRMLVAVEETGANSYTGGRTPTSSLDTFLLSSLLSFRPAGSVDRSAVGVISDSHVEYDAVSVGDDNTYRGGLARLGRVADSMVARGLKPFSFVNGDLLDEGTDGTSAQGLIDTRVELDKLNALVGMGNHDDQLGTSDVDTTAVSIEAFYDSIGDTALDSAERQLGYFTRTVGDLTVMVLNSVKEMAPSEGDYELGSTQKSWITTTLAGLTGGTHRLMVLTHVDPWQESLLLYRMAEADRDFIRTSLDSWVVSEPGSMVVCVVSGHEHGSNNSSRERLEDFGFTKSLNRVDGLKKSDRTSFVKDLDEAGTELGFSNLIWNEAARKLFVYGGNGAEYHHITPFSAEGVLVEPVAFWDCESPTDSTLADGVGSNDLAKTGSPTSVTGVQGNGAGLTASDSWQGSTVFGSDLSTFSGSFWAKVAVRGGTNDSAIISQYNSTGNERGFCAVLGNGSSLGNTNDNFRVFLSENGTSIGLDYRINTLVDDGEWHHYAFTFNAGVLKLYMDGVEAVGGSLIKTVDSGLSVVNASTEGVEIGAVNGGTTYQAACEVDEVGLWAEELTAVQIQVLAAAPPSSTFIG